MNRTPTHAAQTLLLAAALGFVAAVGGCGSATVERPLAATLGGADPVQQMEFWHRLADEPVTSNDDAFHALLLFEGGEDAAGDYAGRVKALKDKGLLGNGFAQPANQGVDRGALSVALAKALKIRGGLVMSVFGPSPRYATKELEFAEVYPASSPNQTFSGSEFLAVMSRAEEYQKAQQPGGPSGGAGYVPPEMELKHGGTSGAAAPRATQPTGA
ncbi:MAG: hypothetical protein JWO31_1196, partial [Phycisphaerales bacterium]|nr:hypothetical protein [Phycisphaerales bacterium]